VDDNHDIADSEAMLLRIVGFEAQACYDGHTALEIATAFRPSICLIDLHMPGMHGDELARRLRDGAASRPLVLVAVTAMCSPEFRRRTAEAGFDMHLVKPVDPHQLLDELDGLGLSPESTDTG
jgi:CheY-like chemotaxis protein